MSTLSELIPSGGTQNNIEFVAQGTLANGQTVALRSDGKVEAIAATGAEAGTSYLYADTNVDYENPVGYDPDNNKILYIWKQSSAYYSIGTVSGTSITFSTPVQWRANSDGSTFNITIVYNTEANGFAISYSDGGNNSYQTVVGASLSGSTLTFGTPVVFNSNGTGRHVSSVYASLNDKVLIAYKDDSNSGYGTCVSLTMSNATTISAVGSEAVFSSSNIIYTNLAWSPVSRKAIVTYSDYGQSGRGTARTITLSGNNISYGTAAVYSSVGGSVVAAGFNPIVYDSVNEQFLIGFQNATTSPNNAYFCSATISGTNLTFGTSNITSPTTGAGALSGVFDVASGEALFFMYDNTSSNKGTMVSVGGTGNTLSIGTPVVFSSNETAWTGGTYDSTANKVVATYSDSGDGVKGKTFLASAKGTNATSFIGITNAAISSGATGEVAVKGGLSTGGNLLPYAPTAGSPVTYESGFAVTKSVSYDTNANKAVIANRRGSDDYGIVYVGTVSGTSISFGSVAVFNAGTTEYISSAFDSNANKVVIAYTDSSNSGYGTAIVGTVSGTSITFGTEAVFEAAAVNGKSIVFDSTSNKVVIFYEDDANNDYGTAVVGTVSGTSISFGTPVVFDSVNMQITDSGEGAAYDSANNRAVIFYRNFNYEGYAAVGTVSGTSISFGTPVKFSSGAAEIDYISAAFDSAANKIVTSYTVNTDSGYSKAIVGTVSGTSISFGSEATFESADSGYTSATFNSTINKVVISYSDFANSNYGTLVISTISGTSISFTTPAVFTSTTAARYISTAFDPDTGSVISGFSDQNNSYYAKSVVTSFSNALTIGSTYYVQDDGNLATTSSSTKAGKAISTTALNLVDPT